MTQKIKSQNNRSKPAGPALSLDTWAVALALALSVLIWVGWIKHVPW
jgi:hypothetical protein